MATRVAVVGARGIGRHHANWWHLEGAEVCAILGTSDESVRQAGANLRALFGFSGTGYTDFDKLLREQQPHIVDVCSPPSCHAAHVRQALEAGCHVLCEKPFVFDPGQSAAHMLAEARRLIELAEAHGLRLSVCTQYSAGARIFRDYWEEHHPGTGIHGYKGHIESPAKGRPADPERIWVDLAPHVISVFTALFPGAQICLESAVPHFQGYEASVTFEAQPVTGGRVYCDLYTGNRVEPPDNVRQFALNETCFDVQGARDAEGAFCAHVVTPQGVVASPDMVRLLIRRFLSGEPEVDGAAILENLSLMLAILGRAVPEH